MTRHNRLRDFIAHAHARSTPLARARFGDLVADILVDEETGPQGFERALLASADRPEARFAIVSGDDPGLTRIIPQRPEAFHVVSDDEIYACWRPAPDGSLAVFDRQSHKGAVWYPGRVPPGAFGQPCETLIHAAIEPSDWVIAHGAAVGRNGRFVVLVGTGKAGKSTATLACVRAGWDYSGDDLILLNPRRGVVAPLYSSARLRHSGVAEFQSLADAAFMVSDEEGAPRYELRLDQSPSGGKVVAMLGVRRRGASDITISPARPRDYMGPLLADSTIRAPGCTASVTPKLMAAGRMAPAFLIDTGMHPSAIPARLEALLDTAPSPGGITNHD